VTKRKSTRPPPPWAIEHDSRTGRIAYLERGVTQSAADANGISLGDYVHAMYGFLRQKRCREVLMIGCGGGTLATMLARAGVHVTAVDINPRTFEIARRYFQLPDSVTCHVGDGARFLARRARYDAIVLDAYDGKDIPAQFRRPAFFALARSRLKRGDSLFILNMIIDGDGDTRPIEMVDLMQDAWRDVRVLDSPSWSKRNAIIAAGAVAGLKRPHLLLKPGRFTKVLRKELADMQFVEL
jgi:spermidine synthase